MMSAEPEFQAKAEDILTVIDSAEDQIALTEILTTAGYKTRPVEDPKSAIEAAILHSPDLVLLDIETSKISSFELYRQLQQNEGTREVPVIIICNLDNVQDRLECFDAGRVDFISKPAQEIEILLRVNFLLQLRDMQLRQEAVIAERTTQLDRLVQEHAEEVHFAEEQVRIFFETSPMGAALTSFEGRFLAVNKTLADMLRTTERKLLQSSVREFYVDPEHRNVLLKELRRKGTLRDHNFHILRDDGTSFYARLNSSKLKLGGRELILALVDDATEQILDEQEAAIIEERARLTRGLHDSVSQTIYSAGMIAEATQRMMDKNPDMAQENLGMLSKMIRGASAEMRSLLLELRPDTLQGQSLGKLLEIQIVALRARTPAVVSLNIEGDRLLPDNIIMAFHRIAQEALNNIGKYAEAGEVMVDLSYSPKGVKMCINDDGRGFDRQATPAGHLGIGIMRERSQKIGADFQINSEPGAGTSVAVSWSDN